MYLLNKFSKTKILKYCVLVIPFLLMFWWNGVTNINELIKTYSIDNLITYKNSVPRKQELDFETYLKKEHIFNEVLVVTNVITDEFVFKAQRYFDNTPLVTKYNNSWDFVIRRQLKNKYGKINQFNNILIPKQVVLQHQNAKFINYSEKNVNRKLEEFIWQMNTKNYLKQINKNFYEIFRLKTEIRKNIFGQTNDYYWFERK